jgi:hypothetical protein
MPHYIPLLLISVRWPSGLALTAGEAGPATWRGVQASTMPSAHDGAALRVSWPHPGAAPCGVQGMPGVR